MKINKIREMSTEELEKEVVELKKELFKLNFALATNGLENPKKIKEVIGSGGSVIRSICEKSNTKIEIEDSGLVKIAGVNSEEIKIAKNLIEEICTEPEINKTYDGEVVKLLDFGAVVSFMGANEGLVHISEISDKRIDKIESVLKIGDKVRVKLTDIRDGKIRLSIKQAK